MKNAARWDYAGKRVRHIYPAYTTVIIAMISLGAVITTVAPTEYFGLPFARFALANLTFLNFLNPTLPGVFVHNPFAAVDGSLWTIKIEVMFYIAVPIIAWTCRYAPGDLLFCLIYVLSAIYYMTLSHFFAVTGREAYATLLSSCQGR